MHTLALIILKCSKFLDNEFVRPLFLTSWSSVEQTRPHIMPPFTVYSAHHPDTALHEPYPPCHQTEENSFKKLCGMLTMLHGPQCSHTSMALQLSDSSLTIQPIIPLSMVWSIHYTDILFKVLKRGKQNLLFYNSLPYCTFLKVPME